jgi:hypothetical protein
MIDSTWDYIKFIAVFMAIGAAWLWAAYRLIERWIRRMK